MAVYIQKLGDRIVFLFALLSAVGCLLAQSSSMSIGSGSAVRGGSVPLTISLASGSAAPAGVQWTLSYPTSDISSVTASAGAALTAAGKTLSCNPQAGTITCQASGMNGNVIGAGAVAVLNVTLSTTGTGTSLSLPLSGVMGALPDGNAATMTGAGGTITVTTPVLPTVSNLQCSPSTVVSGGSANCTITLSSAPSAGGAVVIFSDNSAFL